MKNAKEKGWRRSGMSSYDYGYQGTHDHDRRFLSYHQAPRGYRRQDERIREEVSELLKWDPDVDASEIEVWVKDCVVRLTGTVDSRHAKRRAERILDHVFGVLDVLNELTIKPALDVTEDKVISRGEDGLYTSEITPI